eukprot:12800154-Ditylum_brightwellii.AAC.1
MNTMLYHQKSFTAIGQDLTQVNIVSSFQSKGWNVSRWDFKAADNYITSSSLEYKETSTNNEKGKQQNSIKNIIIKERHQFLCYINKFLLYNNGFKILVAKLGAKDKTEYGALKPEFLSYKGKRGEGDLGTEAA